MNTESAQPCDCELCRPNWFLGRDDVLLPQPVEQGARQAAQVLEEDHFRKVTNRLAEQMAN